jgi:chromosome segregation ATPase
MDWTAILIGAGSGASISAIVCGFIIWTFRHYIIRGETKRDAKDAKREQKQTQADERADVNRGKEIDADSEAMKLIANRLLETEKRFDLKVDALQKELTDYMVQVAIKNTNLAHLETENASLKEKIAELRKERREQDLIIDGLKRQIDALTLEVRYNSTPKGELGTEQLPLHVTVDE